MCLYKFRSPLLSPLPFSSVKHSHIHLSNNSTPPPPTSLPLIQIQKSIKRSNPQSIKIHRKDETLLPPSRIWIQKSGNEAQPLTEPLFEATVSTRTCEYRCLPSSLVGGWKRRKGERNGGGRGGGGWVSVGGCLWSCRYAELLDMRVWSICTLFLWLLEVSNSFLSTRWDIRWFFLRTN